MNLQDKKIGVFMILLAMVLIVLNYTGGPVVNYYSGNREYFIYRNPSYGIILCAVGIFTTMFINDSKIKKFIIQLKEIFIVKTFLLKIENIKQRRKRISDNKIMANEILNDVFKQYEELEPGDDFPPFKVSDKLL